jgi:Sec-independent protein secretion pathway component TatC
MEPALPLDENPVFQALARAVGIKLPVTVSEHRVSMEFLRKNLRYVILAVAIVVAVVTPTPNIKSLAIFMIFTLGVYVAALVLRAFKS